MYERFKPRRFLGPAFLALAFLTSGCDGSTAPPKQAQGTSTPTVVQDDPADFNVLVATSKWGKDGTSNVDQADILTDNWYVVMDGSGSMSSGDCSSGKPGGRIVDAKEAMIRFERGIPANDNLGLYVFDQNAWSERVPLGRGQANRTAYETSVDSVTAGSYTPLGPSLDSGFAALKAQAAKQGGYGTYHLVVVTDGQADDGSYGSGAADAMKKAVDAIVKTPVALETIGYCIEGGHALNRPGITTYRDAMDPASLNRSLEAISAETDAFKPDPAEGSKP